MNCEIIYTVLYAFIMVIHGTETFQYGLTFNKHKQNSS